MKALFEGRQTGGDYKMLMNEGKSLDATLDCIEEELIINALKECSFNITKSAERLGIKRQNLQHKIKKYQIRIES